MKFPQYYLKLFESTYNHLYSELQDNRIHCFLCGSSNMSFRDFLKTHLDKQNIKVIYAENLFQAIVHNKSQINHLDLEQILASSVELILIVLEGPGALVELGMFSSDENTINKLMVLIDDDHKTAESFINLGPVKKIRELGDLRRIFYYKSVEDEKEMNSYENKRLKQSLKKYESEHTHAETIASGKQVLNIISLYYFLKIIIFIYNPIDVKEINDLLNYLCVKEQIPLEEQDIKFQLNSVISWLKNEDFIKRLDYNKYQLTREGITDIREELYKMFGAIIIDNYRVQALNYQLRIKSKIC